MENCIFCKIVKKELGSEIVYEDEEILAFKDINPQAPVHILIIPKRHISSLNEASGEDGVLLGKILLVAKELARRFNIDFSGYRIVLNTNFGAGQSVYHIHFHLLGGRFLTWPPG